MYFIGLDVHKKSISFCVKDAAGLPGRHEILLPALDRQQKRIRSE
jgi:hypothetical protein